MEWSDIADKHNLTPADRKAFFLAANTFACALSGNITLAVVKENDMFLSLPVGRSFDGKNRIVEFREIYHATNQSVRRAMDEFIDEYKKWLKIT
jgi:hypothetical protein